MAMIFEGEERIGSDIRSVWEALNDPAVLRASIPGCESLDKTSDTDIDAVVAVKIGPVKARFKGAIVITRADAPSHFAMTGEGKGGVAGFAKGGAQIELREIDAQTTLLVYSATVEIGGKIAQLGSRLIQGTAQKLTAEFFGNFNKQVGASEPAA